MMLQSKKNNSKALWIGLKLLIALLALWFIYKRVVEKENTEDWWQEARIVISSGANIYWFLLVFLLMLMNWAVEAIKWRSVIQRLESITFWRALEAVFSGITISLFTPNRIGEYAGRVFHLETADRIEATLVTVLENFSQLVITLVFGSVAAIFYLYLYSDIPAYLENALITLALMVASSSLLFYYNVSLVEVIVRKFRKSGPWDKYFMVFSSFSSSQLTKLLALASIRYLIFSYQFYVLLLIFGVAVPYLTAIVLIAVTYLLMSIVPTFALTELGVRGAIATFFFVNVTGNLQGVINASFSLWLINLAIPALLGVFFVFEFKFVRRKV